MALQVATVFLSSFVAGTLLNQIVQFTQNPTSVLTVLGTGAPQVASFFITYVIFN
ncbi:MaoC-like dehydratase [Haematococcus lacustris]|uniref:MaoC-like dehydratase n=1 Tax=Haematococcus lacustris TaxID=44745 RepID=A0A699ZW29_HAELA|nr:MaoC-like dehydratase [Haematococcus lacustris]